MPLCFITHQRRVSEKSKKLNQLLKGYISNFRNKAQIHLYHIIYYSILFPQEIVVCEKMDVSTNKR